jgi:CBS domain-containing protein
MAEMGLRPRMLVKDVMSSPVITVDEDATAVHVAELMEKHELGCIIVVGREGKPVGIITERDLVTRVLAKNLKPDAVKAKDVMTTPLITIGPDETINEAARKMSRLNIRRLGVVYKGELIGLISSKDILAVMPELIETIYEKVLIESQSSTHTVSEEIGEEEATEEETSLSGYCDRCGGWSDNLKNVEGSFLCEDCRAELEESQ